MSILGEFAQVSIAAFGWLLWFFILSHVCLFSKLREMLPAVTETNKELYAVVIAVLVYMVAIAARHYGGYAFRHIRNHYTGWYVFAVYAQTAKTHDKAPWFRQWSDRDVVEALSKAYDEPWPGFWPEVRTHDSPTERYGSIVQEQDVTSPNHDQKQRLGKNAREAYNRARDLMLDKAGTDLAGHFSYHYHVKRVAQHGTLPLALSFSSLWLLTPAVWDFPVWGQAWALAISVFVGFVVWWLAWSWVFSWSCRWTRAAKSGNENGCSRRVRKKPVAGCKCVAAAMPRLVAAWECIEKEQSLKWLVVVLVLLLAFASSVVGLWHWDDVEPQNAVLGIGLPCILVGGVLVYLAAMEARERYKWMIDIVARFVIQRDKDPTSDS